MNFSYLGTITYKQGTEANTEAPVDTILGMEHPKTISLGIRARPELDIQLGEEGFDIQYSDRGGQATIHNPGQLVIYPKIDLRKLNLGLKETVCRLLKVTAKTLEYFGVAAHTVEKRPGLYTSQGKIAFIGLRIRQGVIHHGLSLNVRNDLQDFHFIRSCGVRGESFDSLANHNVDVELEGVFSRFCEDFCREFGLTRHHAPTKLTCLSKDTMRI